MNREFDAGVCRSLWVLVALSALCVFVCPGANAKETTNLKIGRFIAVGYCVDLPEQPLGFFLCGTQPKGVGLYLDFKTSIPMGREGSDDFYENISVSKAEGWGDRLIDTDETWLSFNIGMTKVVLSRAAVYAAAGLSLHSGYRQYKDEFYILGDNGEYWIEDEEVSETTVNGLGGIIIQLSEFWVGQIGVEAMPAGITIGIGRGVSGSSGF